MEMLSYSKERNFFEEDHDFDPSLKSILLAYNQSARLTSIWARNAVRSGEQVDMTKAQWHEAVTQTIEVFLRAIEDPDEEIDLPEPPNPSK